jgi:hypothetical protein
MPRAHTSPLWENFSVKRAESRKELQIDPLSGAADSRELLERIGRILVHSGCTPEQLRREFEDVCRNLEEPTHRWDPERPGFVSDLPHVLARWHQDEHYLDSEGRPVPLLLEGGGRSLKALIARVLPSAEPAQVLEILIDLGAVRRQGKHFLPTGRQVFLNTDRPVALAHGLSAILGMLRTVEHNLSVAPDRRLFERTAINPRFPASQLRRFHLEFARRAAEVIWDVDVDMHREEARRRSGKKMRLGVGLYVFHDAPAKQERRPTYGRAAASGNKRRAREGRKQQ